MHRNAPLVAVAVALALVVGCPSLKLGAAVVKPGSATADGFTLALALQVEETDETEGPDQQRQSGKGLLGLRLPAGWTVAGARMQSPFESAARALFAVPQGAAAFAEAFPGDDGVWWAFASATQAIPQGSWDYAVEVDVVVPKKAKAGALGVAATVLSDDLKDLPAPLVFDVVGKGAATKLVPRSAAWEGPAEEVPPDGAKAPTGF